MCPLLDAPINGQVEYSADAMVAARFGTSAIFSCIDSYGIDNEQYNLICGGDGTSLEGVWDNEVPTCQGIPYCYEY